MLSVKVLGPGCSNCERVEKLVQEIVSEMALDAKVEKVKDRSEFARYGLMYTPGLVLNEKLVCGGRIPSKSEVTSWVTSALEQSRLEVGVRTDDHPPVAIYAYIVIYYVQKRKGELHCVHSGGRF